MDCGISEAMDALSSPDIGCDAGNFECNICFELAQDPIVTLCGHLYCWSCLYQWLQLHSHSHECPVCKAVVHEDKLIPIYGRGKSSSDLRPRLIPQVNIPNRPVGQRPHTAPPVDINYFRQDELDPTEGFSPMAAARFGNLTLSTFLNAIPAIFNLQVHGFHDATVYGATTGVPYMFTSSFHGGYVHGFNHSNQEGATRFLLKMLVLSLGFLVIVWLLS